MTRVRRVLNTRRVGHGGTLDPFASGLLPLLVGRATRLASFVTGLPKCYDGVLRLGRFTDTDDDTGAVLADDASWERVTDEALAEAIASLTGLIDQVPPRFSAKKVGGIPAYRHARRGAALHLASRSVEVRRFACTGRSGPDVRFTVEVGSGTYVRALARDLGARLGCGAHLTALRRVTVGPWHVGDAVALDALQTGVPIRPPLAAVEHLPRRLLETTEAAAVCHGRTVPAGDAPAGPIALCAGDALVAVAVRRGGDLVPRVVLAE